MDGGLSRCFAPWLAAAALGISCTPLNDLDKAASGNGTASLGGASDATGGTLHTGGTPSAGGASTVETGSSGEGNLEESGGTRGEGGVAAAGGSTRGSGGSGWDTGGTPAAGTCWGGMCAMGGTHETGGSSAGEGGTQAAGGATSSDGGAPPSSDGSSSAMGGSAGSAAVAGSAGSAAVAASAGSAAVAASAGSIEVAGAAGSAGETGGGGAAGSAGTAGAAGNAVAPDLPDLPTSPVSGGITYSDGATWSVDGTQVPAFEIHTPTASYWLVKSAAAIVEITDSFGRTWISFSSGYRPNRGVPNLGGCCQPGTPALLGMPEMSTVLDDDSVTLSHVRLVSKPVDGDHYWLVWDFYLTHVTVTINRAEEAFGFTYHGVPGGNLDTEDRLVLSTGETQSASVALAEDLPGPVEWAYLTSPSNSANSSLYLIQHRDDSVPESYTVADSNSAKFVLGSGQLTSTPIRFSLGIVDSVDHATVSARVQYVIDNIPR